MNTPPTACRPPLDGVDATLDTWLTRHAAASGQRPAICCDGVVVTYTELRERVRRFASLLLSRGIRRGDVVAVQLPNVPEYVVCYLAICAVGAVMQTLHMPYRRAELTQLLSHSGAPLVICLSRFKDFEPGTVAAALRADIATLEHVIVLDAQDIAASLEALSGAQPPASLVAGDADDTFLLLYTSGTTASPKGVPHQYRSFLGNAYFSMQELGIGPGDRLLPVAALSHLYGLFVLHLGLAAGASVVLLPAFTPDAFVDTLAAQAPTAVFAAPAHLRACFDAGCARAGAFAGVRFVCLSGTTVPAPLAEQVDALLGDGRVIQLWGMTETQAGAFGRVQDPYAQRIHTAGRPSPGTVLRTVDEQGRANAPGVEGELQVKGFSVFRGYLDNPGETAAAFTADGWFRTGDLARIDAQGYVTITGRTKELIDRGGVKFNPLDVEAVINAMATVQVCAVIPVPDEALGHKACVVVQAAAAAPSLDDIRAALAAAGVAKYKWPERLEIVASMPLTPTQKIQRGVLLERLAKPGDDRRV